MSENPGVLIEAASIAMKSQERKEKMSDDYIDYIKGLDLMFDVIGRDFTTEQRNEIKENADKAGRRQFEEEVGGDIFMNEKLLGNIEIRCGGRAKMLEYLVAYKDEIKDRMTVEKPQITPETREYRDKAKLALFGTKNVRRVTFGVEE